MIPKNKICTLKPFIYPLFPPPHPESNRTENVTPKYKSIHDGPAEIKPPLINTYVTVIKDLAKWVSQMLSTHNLIFYSSTTYIGLFRYLCET